jgi:hypothetical protein
MSFAVRGIQAVVSFLSLLKAIQRQVDQRVYMNSPVSSAFAAPRLLLVLAALNATLVVPAYAQTPAPDVSYRVTPNGIIYTVSQSETLSGIARRFTGRIADWRIIGETNKISNDRTIPIGRQIIIPARLLAPKSAFARIEAFFGNIRIRGNDGNGIETKIGTLLKEGDSLTTLANSFISLVLDDGTRFTLPPDSMLNLRLLRATQFIDQPRTQLFLEKGRVESHVTPLKSPGASYEVISPIAVSGVRGTSFRVNADGQKSLSEVLEGKVAVNNAPTQKARGNGQLIAKGFGTVVENGRVARPIALLEVPALADGYQVQQRLPIQFNLSQSSAQSFRVTVSTDEAGFDNIAEINSAGIDGKAAAKLDTLEDGHYFVRVSAIDAQGLQGLQKTLPFTVKARPFPPFLLQPGAKFQGNASDDKIAVTMQWSEAAGVSGYRLQVATDSAFADIAFDRNITQGAAEQVVPLQVGTYYWRLASIAVRDGAPDQGPFGDAKKLQVLAGQAAPSVSLGENETSFTWTATAGQRFTFQISTSAAFDTLLKNVETVEPEARIQGLDSGTYYARVRSTDADGFVGAFSPPQKFSIPVVWRTQYGVPLRSIGDSVNTDY